MLPLHTLRTERRALFAPDKFCFGCLFYEVRWCTSTFTKAESSLWDPFISKLIRCGDFAQALSLYERMPDSCSSQLSERTFVALLKACTKLKDVFKARKIHAKVFMEGLLQKNIFIGSALVDTYAKCGALPEAQEVFELLPRRDVVAWTALIAGYAQNNQGQDALCCFERMQLEGVASNVCTFVCILKACGSAGALDKGEEIHAEVANKGFLRENVFLSSALIDMYAKCGALEKARMVFDGLPVGDVACWNAMITGYVYHEEGDEALTCYKQMQQAGFSPDAVTFICSLNACCSIRALQQGIELHIEVARRGLLRDNSVLRTALMDMYGKCGDLQKAGEMFHEICNPNVVSWTALIGAYAEHEENEEALACFEQMRVGGVTPNAATFSCAIKVCGNMGAIEKGEELHGEISELKLLNDNVVLGNAVVDMYCKCGLPAKAKIVFDAFSPHSVVLWTTLIAGYVQIGDILKALQVFDRMTNEGRKPSLVTFASILSACSHAGLIDKGLLFFKAIVDDHGLVPTVEHHACMVDLLSRAGQLHIALEVVLRTPFHPSIAMWRAVLGGCRKSGDAELGGRAVQAAVELGIQGSTLVCTTYFSEIADAAEVK